MSKLLLDVPVVAQHNANSCWHAGAFMIWRYWQGVTSRQGPMYTVPEAYAVSDTTPLQYAQYIVLARNVGLRDVGVKNYHSSDDLHGYLKDQGPIWSNGLWFGPGHVIVLTGIDGDKVFFNDPDGGKQKENTVKWFNEKLFTQWAGCLMSKDPARY
jgi:ABC-type bacteriocin/lantibiotic exporter with double-glycine peptidase domain